MSGLAVLLSLAGCLVADPAAARAPAAACPGPARQPAPAPAGVPWTLQRYDQNRLNALADGRGIVVAVIDSGVDARNPQLQGAVQAGPDQLDGGDSALDCVGHGTGVAGIIAARPVAGSPFHGLAPAATILALRVSELVEGEDGSTTGRRGTPAGLAAAIHDAVSRGAKVINLSLVSYRDDEVVRDAVRFGVAHDVVVVAAAGNGAEQGNRTPYPAAYDGVVGVGAIGPDGRRVPTSQTGPYVDLVAPGSQVVTTAAPSQVLVAVLRLHVTPHRLVQARLDLAQHLGQVGARALPVGLANRIRVVGVALPARGEALAQLGHLVEPGVQRVERGLDGVARVLQRAEVDHQCVVHESLRSAERGQVGAADAAHGAGRLGVGGVVVLARRAQALGRLQQVAVERVLVVLPRDLDRLERAAARAPPARA